MDEYRVAASNAGLSVQSVNCLVDAGLSVPSVPRQIGDETVDCVRDCKLRRRMVYAMAECIPGVTIGSPSARQVVRRRPLRSDSAIVGSVARWFGLNETVRELCSCTNGCHFCCINIGLSGEDQCFDLYCPSVDPYCR